MLAIISSASAPTSLATAAIGLADALATAVFIYRLEHKLNLASFFTVVGMLLIVFAGGLLADAVGSLQQLGWLRP
jgi:high-affinity iron transporter